MSYLPLKHLPWKHIKYPELKYLKGSWYLFNIDSSNCTYWYFGGKCGSHGKLSWGRDIFLSVFAWESLSRPRTLRCSLFVERHFEDWINGTGDARECAHLCCARVCEVLSFGAGWVQTADRITAVILIGQTEDIRISVRLLELIDQPRDDDDDICDSMKRVYMYVHMRDSLWSYEGFNIHGYMHFQRCFWTDRRVL